MFDKSDYEPRKEGDGNKRPRLNAAGSVRECVGVRRRGSCSYLPGGINFQTPRISLFQDHMPPE